MLQRLRADWLTNPRAEILAGLVVGLALIPEAIAFSVIAGVDPKVGLYASFTIAIVISFTGGRRGMISAATGAMALVLGPLVRNHGIEYMWAATLLTGAVQIALGFLGIGRVMRFIPHHVVVGAINALAMLVFLAQLDHIIGKGLTVWVMIAIGVAVIYGFQRITTVIPAPLIAVALLGGAAALFHLTVPTVGDMGDLPTSLPGFRLPDVPLDFETLRIIGPISVALALVGLLESLLTTQLMDGITNETSDTGREARGQGIANITTGLFGGMAGCAVIGQSMINLRSGGRTRLSTLSAGVSLLVLILLGSTMVAAIPMAALVAVMIVVSVATFDWASIRPTKVRSAPAIHTIAMIVTVAVVLLSHNLAYGVFVGVILTAIAGRLGFRITAEPTPATVVVASARSRRFGGRSKSDTH